MKGEPRRGDLTGGCRFSSAESWLHGGSGRRRRVSEWGCSSGRGGGSREKTESHGGGGGRGSRRYSRGRRAMLGAGRVGQRVRQRRGRRCGHSGEIASPARWSAHLAVYGGIQYGGANRRGGGCGRSPPWVTVLRRMATRGRDASWERRQSREIGGGFPAGGHRTATQACFRQWRRRSGQPQGTKRPVRLAVAVRVSFSFLSILVVVLRRFTGVVVVVNTMKVVVVSMGCGEICRGGNGGGGPWWFVRVGTGFVESDRRVSGDSGNDCVGRFGFDKKRVAENGDGFAGEEERGWCGDVSGCVRHEI
ncbi:Uncharacterized protein M6B38_246855 [Iris pallida]|uniref:Uncharacterized protein n=1 Tax=Iris pallida TaxID=29817 RepID=A0AAX6DH77_IRIPA|nr:Uncharacterized protein M6B38_246855 [Iris pallida]